MSEQAPEGSGRFREFWQSFRRNRMAVLGVLIVLLLVVSAGAAPLLFPDDPRAMVARPFVPPFTDLRYALGTDALGRDMLAMLVHGARVSLTVGFVATAVAMTLGLLVGSFAGYYGGAVDDVLMRVTEMFQTMPHFLLALALVSVLGPHFVNIVLVIGLISWPGLARLVRAEFLTLREREFVQACRAMGMRDTRIVLTEILPNALPPAIVMASVVVAFSILLEAALAFLGIADQNLVSWGWMIGQGKESLRTAWWLVTFPGFAIVIAVLGVSLASEGLNDALNPHRRGRR